MQKRRLLFLLKQTWVLGQGRAGLASISKALLLAICVLAWRGARRGGLFQHGSGFMGSSRAKANV